MRHGKRNEHASCRLRVGFLAKTKESPGIRYPVGELQTDRDFAIPIADGGLQQVTGNAERQAHPGRGVCANMSVQSMMVRGEEAEARYNGHVKGHDEHAPRPESSIQHRKYRGSLEFQRDQ